MQVGSCRQHTFVEVLEMSSAITMPKGRLAVNNMNTHDACASEVWQTVRVVQHMMVCVLSRGTLVGSLPGFVK